MSPAMKIFPLSPKKRLGDTVIITFDVSSHEPIQVAWLSCIDYPPRASCQRSPPVDTWRHDVCSRPCTPTPLEARNCPRYPSLSESGRTHPENSRPDFLAFRGNTTVRRKINSKKIYRERLQKIEFSLAERSFGEIS